MYSAKERCNEFTLECFLPQKEAHFTSVVAQDAPMILD